MTSQDDASTPSSSSSSSLLASSIIYPELQRISEELSQIIQRHETGQLGFLTREWGFTAPNGVIMAAGNTKWQAWERKLHHCQQFFWPLEAYLSMEEPPYGQVNRQDQFPTLDPTQEELYQNTALHEFLEDGPPILELQPEDYQDYRTASQLLILLGTLAHLYGNSGPGVTPDWIQTPLLQVANRLQVAPTLSGHFLVQENWKWKEPKKHKTTKTTSQENETSADEHNDDHDDAHAHAQQQQKDLQIITTLLQEVDLEDRRYRFKIYPSVCLGSDMVDVVMGHNYVSTRPEAVRLLRHLNAQYHFFHHVTHDHLLMDKALFYRFRSKWLSQIVAASESSVPDAEEEDATTEEKEPSTNITTEGPPIPQRTARPSARLIRPKDVWRQLSGSGGGSGTGTGTGTGPCPRSSKQTFRRRLSSSDDGNSSVTSSNSQRRRASKRTSWTDIPLMASLVWSREDSNTHDATTTSNPATATTTEELLPSLPTTLSVSEAMSIIAIMAQVPVKDRRYHLRVYKQCFVGRQLVDVLLDAECVSTRAEAVILARTINDQYSLFQHVVDDHLLSDEYLFFRFTDTFQALLGDTSLGNATATVGDPVKVSLEHRLSGKTTTTTLHEITRRTSIDVAAKEFRFDSIEMLYPAFGNNHEKVNQLIPACMGHAMAGLPFLVLDILHAMRDIAEAEMNRFKRGEEGTDKDDDDDGYEQHMLLYELIYKAAHLCSRCKEEFQQMSTDPNKRTFNSKYVSIKQTQPLSNGVWMQLEPGTEPKKQKGTTGTQFPYFHLLDWLLGRFQFHSSGDDDSGLVAKIAAVDDTFPVPQREFIQCLSRLTRKSTLRGFLEAIHAPPALLTAYNYLMECYAGEGGVLQAHSRKLYSYIHNYVQSSTSGTQHLAAQDGGGGCPMHASIASDNHKFAVMMFQHMRHAGNDRWKLRLPPLMTEVGKVIYSTSESGGFCTVALDISDAHLQYQYSDVVKVLLPNTDKTTFAWVQSLNGSIPELFNLETLESFYRDNGNGWGWAELFEALGWDADKGVPFEWIARYIEQGQIQDQSEKLRWVNSPIDVVGGQGRTSKLFAMPPPLSLENVTSMEPVSPRVYSVSGVEVDRVFLLVSAPQDGAKHHGYERMSDPQIDRVHCSFSPATFFLIPPRHVNLVCIASGTGISPFVGLVDAIGARPGSYTIVHQCKSSDLFLASCQTWLDFSAVNPGAVILGYISGDRSRRNHPMRYVVLNGALEEVSVLRRHNSSAYYFGCDLFQDIIRDRYDASEGALNLAYCCGGVKSAIQPFRQLCQREGMHFEYTMETYGVPVTFETNSISGQIGGSVVNLDHVGPIHPGGDQILHQIHDICLAEDTTTQVPDHSVPFYQLHPHAYNLHRCLRAPMDSDADAFAQFLERQRMSHSAVQAMAMKYAQVALSNPKDSKVVRIATELQSSVIREYLRKGGPLVGSAPSSTILESAKYLESLLKLVPQQEGDATGVEDPDAAKWSKSLREFKNIVQSD